MLKKVPIELSAFKEYNQFILWRPVLRDSGKTDKIPINPHTGYDCDAHDPRAWMPAPMAENMAGMYGGNFGLGFVFTENDPFYFVDIDECLRPDGQGWTDSALFVLSRLPGAAVEVSYSNQGLHVFGRGVPPAHGCKNKDLGCDLYTEKRFAALTGTNVIGSAAIDHSAQISALATDYFKPGVADISEWTAEPVPEWNGLTDDNKLIERALKTKSAGGIFGGKCSFSDLWEAKEEALIRSYPPERIGSDYNASGADAALAQHLSFWTGKNSERMFLLMWKSGLVRDKWHARDDYLVRTINAANSFQTSVYTAGPLKEIAIPVNTLTDEPTLIAGYQYQSATLQLQHFVGCVYVQDLHRIFTPSGAVLKSEQFNATYGGYVFQLDETGDKTTRKAWDAFTESQVVRWPRADSKCFRPELSTGALIREEERTYVNTYVPVETPKQAGDPAPFISHLEKLLPNPQDKAIFIAYMAACIQHKGVKFQWAPLLQGVEGNGKTLFTRCVAFAIGRRYTHMPISNELSEKFNEWLFEKLLIGIEDVYVPAHKQEIIEILKPMITNPEHAMRAMQQGQVMRDNRANFMLNSNHKDGIRKTHNDRRFCVFYTAQQKESDIVRDGMAGDYFPRLYEWLRNGGYAIVAGYLTEYQIPEELNPATLCHRAPRTSSTDEAVKAGLGSIEQEIIEAIDEGRPGFSGGWISSVAVERMLQLMHASRSIPHNKRRELLQNLGYDWHPSLKNGRANNSILIDDGKKPILFIKTDHIHRNLSQPAEIARFYQEAQGARPSAVPGPVTNLQKM